ncbi:hypothetical protein HAP94_18230 [Acidithiobacillus ferrivorans]|nr:hypothetical protein [Acidithiobacillus ferrivorans]
MRRAEAGIKGVHGRQVLLHAQMPDGFALDLAAALGGKRGARTHDELVEETAGVTGGILVPHALWVGARMAALACDA